jgi:hypothetical protein
VVRGQLANIIDRKYEAQTRGTVFRWQCLCQPSVHTINVGKCKVVLVATNVEAAIDEVPEPAPRIMRPITNMATFCAAVMKVTPMSLRITDIRTPCLRPTRSTTGPIKVDTIAQPRNAAAEFSDLVAVVSFNVSV